MIKLPFNTPRIYAKKRIGPHSLDILEILIGSLLGDGTMEKDGDGARFRFYQEKTNGEYLLYLHKQISELGYCNPQLPQIQIRKDKNKIRYVYRMSTFTFSSFIWIYDAFYTYNEKNKRRKIIPPFIEDYFSDKVFAFWIMDDGCYIKQRGIKLSTNSFTLKEVKILISIIKKKYSFNCSIHKTGVVNQYNIYIPKKYLPQLIHRIKKHFDPSMYYKLGY